MQTFKHMLRAAQILVDFLHAPGLVPQSTGSARTIAPSAMTARSILMRRAHLQLTTLLAAVLLAMSFTAHASMKEIELTIGEHKLIAEVASTDAERSKGLMHRRMLPENRGMVFVFRDIALHGMWMMNTYIPLSVAFIDKNGVIINIADMQPHSRESHSAKSPVKYALEMNQGWFAKRGIKAGHKVEGLDKAGPAR
jgi:uncharacterized protein